jgi:iron complex outermembrane recepter protein
MRRCIEESRWLPVAVLSAMWTAAPARAEKVRIAIEAQPLNLALVKWGTQTSHDVLVENDQVSGIEAPALSGAYEPEEALNTLLANSGFTYCYTAHQGVRILPSDVRVNSITRSCQTPEITRYLRGLRSPPTRLRRIAPDTGRRSGGIPEVLVRGSRILNADIERTEDDVQPYVVLDREKITRSGASNLNDLIGQEVLANSGPANGAQEPGLNGNASRITLRGLTPNQTQILIDGRPVARREILQTPQQPDINGIPLAAIERIEVLPTTASGIYGGGATGGVVNVVLRRDYNGVETEVAYGSSLGGGGANRGVNISGGFSSRDESTSFLFTIDYSRSEPLLVHDRESLVDRARNLILQNNSAQFYDNPDPVLGATTNIRSADGQNLTLKNGVSLNAPVTHVPQEYAGTVADGGAALAANAGSYNFDLAHTAQSGGERAALGNTPTTLFANVSLLHDFSSETHGFVDVSMTLNKSYLLTNAFNGTAIVSADAPNNPFAQSIRVTTPALGMNRLLKVELSSPRVVVGLTHTFDDTWHLGADFTFNRGSYDAHSPGGLNQEGFTDLFVGKLDVLRDTNVYSVDFSPYLSPDTTFSRSDTDLYAGGIHLAGPLWTISGRMEQRHEFFSRQVFSSASARSETPSREQDVRSAYVELSVPLVSDRNHHPGLRWFEAKVAARYDEYKTRGAIIGGTGLRQAMNRGSSIDPTFGFIYKPRDTVRLRSSFSKGFLVPDIDQLVIADPNTIQGSQLGLHDPRRGNEPIGTLLVESGGSDMLEPERSRSYSAGVEVGIRGVPLTLSADWVRILKRNEIVNFTLKQDTINDEEQLPEGIVVRASPVPGDKEAPRIIAFNAAQTNLARRRIDALDLSLTYTPYFERSGQFTFSANGVRQLHSESQLTSSGPRFDTLGLIQALKWKANAELTWERGMWQLGWATHYLDAYWLNRQHIPDLSQGKAKVPSQTYHDMFVRCTGSSQAKHSSFEIQLGVKNVFNRTPPADLSALTTGAARYSPLGDAKGASYYLRIRTQFTPHP